MYSYLKIYHIIILVLFLLMLSSCTMPGQTTPSSSAHTSSSTQGTSLGGTPAPNFALIDQNGKHVSLTQFRGMPVILTFFYTHCPDACPLMAEKIRIALNSLGKSSQNVAILAVSVDPKGDTSASVKTFSQVHQMQQFTHWHYLLGTRDVLTPVWHAYNVSGIAANATSMDMTHSSFLYVIDKQGREQTLFDADFVPTQLASDLKQFL